jgi:hypothetical protein
MIKAMETCVGCQKSLALGDVLYNENGQVVCSECTDKAGIVGDEKKAAGNIKKAAFTCVGLAVLSLACMAAGFGLGFWPSAIAGVLAGLFVMSSLFVGNNDRFTKYLSAADKTTILVCTLIGLGICSYETLALFGIVPFHLVLR